MRGLGRMLIAITSLGAVLACQGCVSSVSDAERAAASGPAAPQSLGMTLAAPVPLGGPAGDSQALAASEFLGTAPTSFASTTIINVPVLLTGDALDPESYTTTFTAIDAAPLSAGAWNTSEALAVLAADKSKAALLEPQDTARNIGAEVSFAAPSARTGLAFDVGVAPRIAYSEEGDFASHKFGGELRIGQNFDKRGTDYAPSGSWYVFAGADGEAVVWDTNASSSNLNNVSLTDQVTVGDMQAGISVQRGGGQLSLSYIRREVTYSDRNGGTNESEDFAGVSFTLRR